MMPSGLVEVDRRAHAAFRELPLTAPPGSFWQLGDGEVVRVGPDGLIEQLVRGGWPWGRSIASDPTTARAP
jgi:hypothetical protein